MNVAVFIVIISIVFILLRNSWKKSSWKTPNSTFPNEWRIILLNKIAFYNALTDTEKKLFEYKVHEFILNCRITGIKTDVNDEDRLLVSASAIIPIFQFPEWRYSNLYEVLIYPNKFNDTFETDGPENNILGMVGTGYMEGKMILSKKALHHGFSNENDKKNTAIHEFVHLIDKMDGSTDGVPNALLQKQYTIPWLELMNKKIDEIYNDRSEINPYGGTNTTEFFAVASEYFFESPKLMKQKHPELYKRLSEIFHHNLAKRKLKRKKFSIGRNSPCPCNSGLKFKKCCGKVHY